MRVVLTLLVAVLLPLEQAYCAFTPLQATPDALQTDHHDAGDGHDSPASPDPASPTGPCCCVWIQLPAATTPAAVSLPGSASDSSVLAVVPAALVARSACGVSAGLAPDPRSGSPPDPSSAPQSPRSPPLSA